MRTRQRRATAAGTLQPWTIPALNDPVLNVHPSTTLVDVGANAQRYWSFRTEAGAFTGIANVYEERSGSGTALLRKDYTWTEDAAGNVYVGTVLAALDPGAAHLGAVEDGADLGRERDSGKLPTIRPHPPG